MSDLPGSARQGSSTAIPSSAATPAALQAPGGAADARPRIRCRIELGLGPLLGFQPQQSHVRLVVEHQEGVKRYAVSQPVQVCAPCGLPLPPFLPSPAPCQLLPALYACLASVFIGYISPLACVSMLQVDIIRCRPAIMLTACAAQC
jgi:hypothetical protein